jgi:hypothetical protein
MPDRRVLFPTALLLHAKQAVDSRMVKEAAVSDTRGPMKICDTNRAQSGHNRHKQKGLASLQALDFLVAGGCNRTRLRVHAPHPRRDQ